MYNRAFCTVERHAATFQGPRHSRLAFLVRTFVEIGHAVLGARRCRERSHRQHRCSPHLRFDGNRSQTTLHNPTGDAYWPPSTCSDDEIVSGLSEPGKAEADLLSTDTQATPSMPNLKRSPKAAGSHIWIRCAPTYPGKAGGSCTSDWVSVPDAAPTLSQSLWRNRMDHGETRRRFTADIDKSLFSVYSRYAPSAAGICGPHCGCRILRLLLRAAFRPHALPSLAQASCHENSCMTGPPTRRYNLLIAF